MLRLVSAVRFLDVCPGTAILFSAKRSKQQRELRTVNNAYVEARPICPVAEVRTYSVSSVPALPEDGPEPVSTLASYQHFFSAVHFSLPARLTAITTGVWFYSVSLSSASFTESDAISRLASR